MTHGIRRLALRFATVALVAAIYWIGQWTDDPVPSAPGPAGERPSVDEAFAHRRSNEMVQVSGRVDRIFSDDREGSRHQRFIVETRSGTTVLVAHNIDLAERVPLAVGDSLEVLGEYEWTERGGVLHWTHHDPQGRRAGGWIRHRGREYR